MPKFQCKAQTPQRRFCFAPQKITKFYPFTCIPPLISARRQSVRPFVRRFSVIENETVFFLSFFSLYTSFLAVFREIYKFVCLIFILFNYTICNMVCKELFLKTLSFLLYNYCNCFVVFLHTMSAFSLYKTGAFIIYVIKYKGDFLFHPLLWLQKEGNASIFFEKSLKSILL